MEGFARGALAGAAICLLCFCLLGCESAQQKAAKEQAAEDAANLEAESQSVATTVLGKESEVLLRGDLALNGQDQILIVNRFRNSTADSKSGSGPVFIRRAALLEKQEGRWSEILRCDEHLKNPNGYLRGYPRSAVSGWRLEYTRDANAGIEMKFTPAEALATASAASANDSASGNAALDVRWNKNTKRYQSFDQSHERYLNELPTLETPESYLR
jgi:hypothetical protein